MDKTPEKNVVEIKKPKKPSAVGPSEGKDFDPIAPTKENAETIPYNIALPELSHSWRQLGRGIVFYVFKGNVLHSK